jgi:hypothetical protein
MKPRVLFHGTPTRMIGSSLRVSLGRDSGGKSDNSKLGVYATDLRSVALTRCLANVRCKGVESCSFGYDGPPYGVIYRGWPLQEVVFLYTVPSTGFKSAGGMGHQWVSTRAVEPISEEVVCVSDIIYLVRRATSVEMRTHRP